MLKKSSLPFMILFLITLNFAIQYAIPTKMIYNGRFDYNLILNNVNNTDSALEQIKKDIKLNHYMNYTILLGDSVFFGSPGPSDKSPTAYMQEYAEELEKNVPKIYNLSLPAAQLGDIYTMLLRLDKLGISTENLIFNIRYPSFRPRNPYPKPVFWWSEDLKKLDPQAYERVKSELIEAGMEVPEGMYDNFKHWLKNSPLRLIKWMNYKDYVHRDVNKIGLFMVNKPIPDDSLGDSTPWFMMSNDRLDKWLNSNEIKADYTDKSFDLSEKNTDVYFLNKIVAHQSGKNTLIVFTGSNQTYLEKYLSKEGYIENNNRIDAFIKALPVQYLNIDGKISDDLFTDQTHYTSKGNELLAHMVWDKVRSK